LPTVNLVVFRSPFNLLQIDGHDNVTFLCLLRRKGVNILLSVQTKMHAEESRLILTFLLSAGQTCEYVLV